MAHPNDPAKTPATCDSQPLVHHLHRARVLIQTAYSTQRWQDTSPVKAREKRSWTAHKFCIRVKTTREAIGEYRERMARKFAEYAESRILTPYYGGGEWWAIPAYVVACESGYSWGAYNASSSATGPYQMLPSTYGGVCRTCDWSKLDQHYAASQVWRRSGGAEWSCA